MRQHITPAQLQELTEEQKERLRKGLSCKKEDCLPLLSVGQCIELLEEKDPGSWSICCSKSGGWYITSSNLYAPKYYIADSGKDFEEIIDALWEAVKAVLRNS